MNLLKINIGDKLICPVCGKGFKMSANTVYIAKGGYACDWKCFLNNIEDIKSKKRQR